MHYIYIYTLHICVFLFISLISKFKFDKEEIQYTYPSQMSIYTYAMYICIYSPLTSVSELLQELMEKVNTLVVGKLSGTILEFCAPQSQF